MAASGSTKIVILALCANFLIACAKFAAYLWTSSSAMLSEAIHSLADTSNQALLLYGQRRSQRPPDAKHPFGYARELYFWSFVVAILLFSLGAGFSVYEGIHKFFHPHPIKDPFVNYVVLTLAIALEAVALHAAVKEFNRRRGDEQVLPALRRSKDPALFTIVLEDLAAIMGLFIALIGIMCAHLLGWQQADAIASIAIGLVLAMVATFIAIEVKALLIGEAAGQGVQSGIREIIETERQGNGHIRAINDIRTLQLGARDILVTASVDFDDTTRAADIKSATHRLEKEIRARYPDVQQFYIEVEAAEDHATMQQSPNAQRES